MYISLFVDIEDCGTPLSDDVAKDIADILSDHRVVGNLMVVGDKARILERRGRRDVIAALGRHEIGLHSDRHSRHPTVAEYLAHKWWNDGIKEAIEREGPGVEVLRRVFGQLPSCWGQPGGSWGPQIHPAARHLGIPAVVYPESHTPSSDVHWYGGTLTFGYRHVFGGFDTLYSDDDRFQRHLGAFCSHVDKCLHLGLPWLALFLGHPFYIRACEFGDVLNLGHGKETASAVWQQPKLRSEAEYRTALKNLAALVECIATDSRLQVTPVGRLTQALGRVAERIDVEDLRGYAAAHCSSQGVSVDDPKLSPAQAVDVLARAILAYSSGAKPESFSCRHVDGPMAMPVGHGFEAKVDWETFPAACARVSSFVERTGCVPAQIELDGIRVGIGSFYQAACESFVAIGNRRVPAEVPLRPGAQIPAIADVIARRTERGYRGWVIHKDDLETSKLLELTRLQTWTLKPAMVTG